MKKLLTIAVAAFAITAVNAYTAQQVGVTTISATSQNTIIPVPFTSLADSSAPVTAKDLVKTTGLTDHTWLLYFDGTVYNAWELNSGVWVPAQYATQITGATVSQATENLTVTTGGAMWVVLPSAPSDSVNITVYGTYVEQPTSTITAGKTMLVTNPKQAAAAPSPANPNNGDVITTINGESYTYKLSKSQWGSNVKQATGLPKWTQKTFTTADSAFWYMSTGSSNVTINWNN